MDSSENSTTLLGMPTYPDRASSLWLDPISCRLVSLLSRVECLCPSSLANYQLLSPFSHSLTGVPFLLPVTPRSQVQYPLSGFAPKQTKESSAWRTTYIVLHNRRLTFTNSKIERKFQRYSKRNFQLKRRNILTRYVICPFSTTSMTIYHF